MINKNGQQTMEFLMTYGWVILASVIVIGTIGSYFYFGVQPTFEVYSEQCSNTTSSYSTDCTWINCSETETDFSDYCKKCNSTIRSFVESCSDVKIDLIENPCIEKSDGDCWGDFISIDWLIDNCLCEGYSNDCDPSSTEQGCYLNMPFEYCNLYECKAYSVEVFK